MNRVKKQLHEWDENLKDDSLPTNAVGQPYLCVSADTHAHIPFCLCSFMFSFLPFIPSVCFCQTSPTEWQPVCP